ncbi:hypothetical protein NP493_180g07017 [Ridgeia piscesae]|uniref:SUEL-type lectin domain-containing protein n=1 Tax=Ridgeia piscesae TaxID=27915 RepID=A0AAD9UF54_RIDPI|nr:hypothetical protein NP493_180g07017 [Ridgeia piscesae]
MICTDPKKIHIVNATLGISAHSCTHNTKCCPSNTICTVEATSTHLGKMKEACDGKQTCEVSVFRQRCPAGKSTVIDYESVTYTCDTPQGEVTTPLNFLSLIVPVLPPFLY